MWNAIKQLLASKKVLMTIAGLIVAALAKYGLNVEPSLVLAILGLVASLVLGQGFADSGKEAAKVVAVAAAVASPDISTPATVEAVNKV